MVAEYMTRCGAPWTFGIDIGTRSVVSLSHDNFSHSEVSELIIDDWFYLAKLDDDHWFLRIGLEEYEILPNKLLQRLDNDDTVD